VFVHNINPVLLKIGIIEIRYYGLIYALGFVFCLWYLLQLAKQKKVLLSEDDVLDYMTYLIIGVLLGARIFEVLFYHPDYYLTNPGQIIAYWNGGLSFHGGFVGGIIATFMFIKKKKLEFYDVADAVMVPLALGLAFGRLANFINGELFGKIANVPWAVKFPGAEGYRHPTQLYESFKNFIIFFTLFSLRDKKTKKGFQFWLFITMYGAFRFIIENWKEPETVWFGAPLGQILSAAMFVVGAYMIYRYYSRNTFKA